jgi:hypothetical protein
MRNGDLTARCGNCSKEELDLTLIALLKKFDNSILYRLEDLKITISERSGFPDSTNRRNFMSPQ